MTTDTLQWVWEVERVNHGILSSLALFSSAENAQRFVDDQWDGLEYRITPRPVDVRLPDPQPADTDA